MKKIGILVKSIEDLHKRRDILHITMETPNITNGNKRHHLVRGIE